MDTRQLRYFCAIAEEQTITAAARKLRMAQPPLSQQLKLLEQELGVELVQRHRSGLQLTEAGQALYMHAKRVLHLIDEAESEVKEIGSGLRGKLTIGVNTLSDERLPRLLHQFRERYPQITYKVQQNESAQLCKLIKDRSIELAIIRYPLDLEAFTCVPFRTESFCFVISEQDRDVHDASWEHIQHVPLMLPSTEGLGIFNMIVEQFERRQLTPNLIGECSDIAVLMELVQGGFAATIVPETVLKLHRGYQVRALPIEHHFTSSSVLIWLKDQYLSKAAQHFIKLVQGTEC
ncbi:LysR family transcriptional regulator [Paenibacillus sp. 481]|nr:LysR family transcriptional regulator [Paenibacillus sp. 481]UHA75924.1 LysR family transcriptional regulator [Paenibacillus sp. 481]